MTAEEMVVHPRARRELDAGNALLMPQRSGDANDQLWVDITSHSC